MSELRHLAERVLRTEPADARTASVDLANAVLTATPPHPSPDREGGLSAEDRERLGSLATSLEAAVERGQLTSPVWTEDAAFLRKLADRFNPGGKA